MTDVLYHIGHLTFDRKADPAVNIAAKQAWSRYEQGKAILFQRRLDATRCAYYWRPVKGAN